MIIDMNFLKDLVLDAGKIGMSYFGKVRTRIKNDRTPVTEADLSIDRFLMEKIREKYPDHLILSEERDNIKKKGKELVVWAIDPIDGTAAFASGLPVWGISIGIFVKDFPKFGAVYLPVTDELYYSDGKKSYLGDREIKTGDFEIDRNSFLTVPSDAHRSLDLRGFIGKTRSMGSIAAHLCYVAKGVSIGAVMKPSIWDIAGGCAIMHSAGVHMSCLDGNEIEWRDLYSCEKSKQWYIAASKDKIGVLRDIIKVF